MAWFYLILAGLEEIIAVVAMKYVDGFKRKTPLIIIAAGLGVSFYFLTQAMLVIPSGVAYAVWAGVGSVGIVLVSFFWFKESYSRTQFLFLTLIIIGIIGLRLTT
ncbi:putative membrane protein [Paenibacillus larvae subsp. larvae]|uniref:Putative membrane protein n=1 Tax=Paenibacillus larvae subsp. larvae TaxID=147375 RepID=A0A2L1UHA3_9BACL|nr:multidrug efflux SMR transporter [Paenibacillus larvae]AQT84101.1 QacE family quaternary ammonium compound efflux SMR transporter [Paenibacillus larvae subsp. pulvifaciens]AQZ46017.1 QacE family quaternary ammonium compound efflux SMR transporter [Paenibacillus larvae subsp. pulvifaciens]AVF27657.1 putative membrane protein [Paenibacillus larvae subsp. larvae]AVF32228.1 putative membrane protein [Paenibacillus larvae subsp. larvae]MBH0341063.1 molecular chaperone [Paenibacillus larvae]